MSDLKNRLDRFLLIITQSRKLEMILGLDKQISGRLTAFSGDKRLFTRYFNDMHDGNKRPFDYGQDFIEENMKKSKSKTNTYFISRTSYKIFLVISWLFMIVDAILIFCQIVSWLK